MNTKLINAICMESRPLIRKKRDIALQSLTSAVNEKSLDEIMIEVMNCAQWIRVDLELLLRTAFWLTLSVDELRARGAVDQRDLMQKFRNRLNLSDSEIEALLKRADDLLKDLPATSKQVENNAQFTGTRYLA